MLATMPQTTYPRSDPAHPTHPPALVDSVDRAGPAALDALFAAYAAPVLRAAYRITGDAQDAEDVLQTVFMRLLRQPEAYDLVSYPAAYLKRAAVNAALDVVRSRRRRKVIPLDGGVAEMLAASGADRPGSTAGRDLDDLGELGDLRAALRSALAQLNPRAAEMFALHYFEERSNQEIAHLFDTSPNVVGVTLYRARSQLRDALGAIWGKDLHS